MTTFIQRFRIFNKINNRSNVEKKVNPTLNMKQNIQLLNIQYAVVQSNYVHLLKCLLMVTEIPDNTQPHYWKCWGMVTPWPPNSSDLNPIEHLWDTLAKKTKQSDPWKHHVINLNNLVACGFKVLGCSEMEESRKTIVVVQKGAPVWKPESSVLSVTVL